MYVFPQWHVYVVYPCSKHVGSVITLSCSWPFASKITKPSLKPHLVQYDPASWPSSVQVGSNFSTVKISCPKAWIVSSLKTKPHSLHSVLICPFCSHVAGVITSFKVCSAPLITISELYNIDVFDYEYAAVKEKYGCWLIRPDYINAGMLLLNMKKIAETCLLAKARERIKTKKRWSVCSIFFIYSAACFSPSVPDKRAWNTANSFKICIW